MAAPPASSTSSPSSKASGDTVVPAVLAAAADLFAERGPAATSLRDVAARAGVTYGLVFRHFGTKDSLIAAVLDYLADEVFAQVRPGQRTAEFDSAVDRHTMVAARAILDGYAAERLQSRFPGPEMLVQGLSAEFETVLQARLAAANAIALQISWLLFEPYLRAASGLVDLPSDDLQAAIDRTLAQITDPRR